LNRIPPPKKAPTTKQTRYFAGERISNSGSPSKRTIEIPAVRHITGKNADAVVHAIGFRNRLPVTPLSVLAEPCQVLFLFFIWPLD